MPEPKGKLVTPVGFDNSGKMLSLLLDQLGRLHTIEAAELEFIEILGTATVPAGTFSYLDGEVKPPTGWKYRILVCELRVDAPPGATAGNHAMYIQFNTGLQFILGRSSYNRNIRYYYGEWYMADVLQLPSNPAAQTLFPRGVELDANNYLQLKVQNSTDADQTNTRTWRFLVQKIPLPST